MSEPLVLAIMISEHVLFKFFLRFILIFMHYHMDFEGVDRQKIVIFLNYIKNLVLFEMGKEIYYEFFVVL